jgi:DNA mismatch endonuclease (patch repair protein)
VTDVHDPATRSRNMAAIKGGNTKPELMIRRALHGAGYRYHLHVKDLPGKPDLVFPKYNAALFINGCFWHRHNCHLFKWPKTRQDFWQRKINGNVENDVRKCAALREAGWRVGVVWECALKGRIRISQNEAIQAIINWLESDANLLVLEGKNR